MSVTAKLCLRCKQKDITDFSTCRYCGTAYKVSEAIHQRNVETVRSTDWKIVLICLFWLIPVGWQFLSTRPWFSTATATATIRSIDYMARPRSYSYRRNRSLVDSVSIKYQYSAKNGETRERCMQTPLLPVKAIPVEAFGIKENSSVTVYYDPNGSGQSVCPQIGDGLTLLLAVEYGISILFVGLVMSAFEGMTAMNTSESVPFAKRYGSVITTGGLFFALFVIPTVWQLFSP